MTYEIENGIKAPQAARGEMEELAAKMVENDSVVVPASQAATLGRHIKKTHTYTTSKIDDEKTRVWKLGPKVTPLKEAEA